MWGLFLKGLGFRVSTQCNLPRTTKGKPESSRLHLLDKRGPFALLPVWGAVKVGVGWGEVGPGGGPMNDCNQSIIKRAKMIAVPTATDVITMIITKRLKKESPSCTRLKDELTGGARSFGSSGTPNPKP